MTLGQSAITWIIEMLVIKNSPNWNFLMRENWKNISNKDILVIFMCSSFQIISITIETFIFQTIFFFISLIKMFSFPLFLSVNTSITWIIKGISFYYFIASKAFVPAMWYEDFLTTQFTSILVRNFLASHLSSRSHHKAGLSKKVTHFLCSQLHPTILQLWM